MEPLAFDFYHKGDWIRAADLFNQLLNAKTARSDANAARYLHARSKCLLELKQFEAAIADCRRCMQLLKFNVKDKSKSAPVLSSLRHRLIQALFALKRFGEAELVVQEWVALTSKNGPNQQEVAKILKKLHAVLLHNGHEDALHSQLESKLIHLEEQLHLKMDKEMNADIPVCSYCSITFNNKTELRGHCQTEEHQRVIMSDEGHDWHWRAPPRGCNADSYRLCDNWMETNVCRYGLQCIDAHGQDELLEWKERFEYRRMKLQRAYDTELYGKSYTEELVEKLVQSIAPDQIMREVLDDVGVKCNNKLSTTLSEKNRAQTWVFSVKSTRSLKAVALLQDTHRAYFHIKSIKMETINGNQLLELANRQEWIARKEPDEVVHAYHVEIVFSADIYGTLRQSIVFDFGAKPMLVQHLCVDVVPVTDVEKINEIRKEILLSSTDRWNANNSEIVPFTSPLTSLVPSYSDTETDWAKHLAAVYPTPYPDTFILSQATINEKRLTTNNYRARMQELLYIEEMARYECIARFNITIKLKVIHSYLLSPNSTASSTAKYSSSGELFALIHLGKELSEDTSAGRLILNNCTTILLSPEEPMSMCVHQPKVYEALIEDKGRSMVYLRLSAITVQELQLKPDMEMRAQMQFQLNRIPYCEWHYAIDKIPDFKIIFPEVFLEPNIPWTPSRQWSDSLDSRMNLKQKEAVVAITTPLYVNLPPVLIIGPFGTGKTFTLAQAMKQLIKQPENRILICTQSNSAADLYIKDYLHPYVEEGHEDARPLRIYYHKRWVATVHQTVQKYCLINTSGGMKRFIIPTSEDILKHRIIVVTLSISMYLSTLGLPRGFFTHIFLDEAAQAMECEAIMPLALANDSTRIVLAGDHMQLSPELFSPFAKERNLHVSLLERLYDHYPNGFPCKILLSENYRAHEAIIQFTSELFYEQKLISSGKQPRHEIFYPLTFFTSRGEDVQDLNSTAFYNNAEVYEIVERVQELKKLWPSAWGKFDDQSIGIMTPYSDQVLRIRSELRKRRLYGISVERVLNVQGKQFRAIFLSTVRTRRTCTSGEDSDFGFLSNSKLLNTAITRAQSLVAVVGDPISLCSAGRCSKVWERFIQICDENNSLFGITWLSLRNQLDGVELKKTYVLNPLAPEFVPRKYQEAYMRPLQKFIQNPILIPPQPPVRPLMPPIYPGMFPMLPPQMSMLPQLLPQVPQVPQGYLYPPVRQQPVSVAVSPVGVARVNNSTPKMDELNQISNHIQFRNNVHFPEVMQAKQLPTALTDYINLLPPNMSLVDMLLQPIANQERWYYYLLANKGMDAAKQFEMLILTANRKEVEPQFPVLPPQVQQVQFNSHPQQIQRTSNGGNYMPLPHNSLIPQVANGPWANKPPNSYHNNFPAKNEQFHQPLYLRQSDADLRGNKNVPVGDVGGASTSDDGPVPRQWQQQINAEFANLSLHNGESVDDILKRYKDSSATYASVVRSNVGNNASDKVSLTGPRLYQYF